MCVGFVQNYYAAANDCHYSHSRNAPNITGFIAHSIRSAIHSNDDPKSSITFTSQTVLPATV